MQGYNFDPTNKHYNKFDDAIGKIMSSENINLSKVELIQLFQHAATREDIQNVLSEMRLERDKNDKRWEKNNERWEKNNEKILDKFDALETKLITKINSKIGNLNKILITIAIGMGGALWYICTHIDIIIDILHKLSTH
ncbi:MAG: hypothetical protein K2Y14_03985 [Burkholderiales bacterium]|nr:hypothetical protein [Burkholderiales bacterium]